MNSELARGRGRLTDFTLIKSGEFANVEGVESNDLRRSEMLIMI